MYMARLFVRIDFGQSGGSFGPGKAQLLEQISETGSLRRAAASLGMCYRTAWLLIEEMQRAFNRAVVIAEIGGTGGGGTQLTELGTTLLTTYRRIETDVTQASHLELQNLAAVVQTITAGKRAAKKKRSPAARLKNRRQSKRRRSLRSKPR